MCLSKPQRHFGINIRVVEADIFLDDFRLKIAKRFNKEVDLCDISGLKDDKKADILDGAIYV